MYKILDELKGYWDEKFVSPFEAEDFLAGMNISNPEALGLFIVKA
jgi:hypothetical protein